MAYQQGGMDKLVAQLRNESYNPYGSIQQHVPQQAPQQLQQRQVSLQYRQDVEPIEQYGKYGASNYSSTTFGGHNNHEMLQTSNVLGQSYSTPTQSYGTTTQSYGTTGQMNPITDISSQMDQSALLEQQYQQLQLMQAAQMQAAQKQAQQQAQQQAQLQAQMQSSMQMQPIQKFSMMNSMRQPSQPAFTSVEDLISGDFLSKKIKKDLHTALVVNDFEFHDTVTQIIHAQDVSKTILSAGKRRVVNLLQTHVRLKAEPQVEGLKVWTGLPTKTKEALKANFVSKRFKEAVEEVVTDKDSANKIVVCGREWMKTRMWETFKEEVSFVQTAKRPREEGEEPQGAPELEPQKSTRTGRTVFLSLTNHQRVQLKSSLEKQPFSKAFDELDLCPSDKVLLTGAGAEMMKSLFKQTMGVEPKAYVPGKLPPKTSVKENGSDVFAKLTEDQKVFLKDELQLAGFKATLDKLEQPAAMVESLLKDGREVLKTRLKGHFNLQVLEFYKKPTRDEEAKAKFTALPDNVKQELQGALLKYPFIEALASLGDAIDASTKAVFKSFGRDPIALLLKEQLKSDINLETEDALREKLIVEATECCTAEVLGALKAQMLKSEFSKAVNSAEVPLDAEKKLVVLGAGRKKVVEMLVANYPEEMVLDVHDLAALVFVKMSTKQRQELRELVTTKIWSEAEPLLKVDNPVQRSVLAEVGARGLKAVLEQHYGEELFFPGLPGSRSTKTVKSFTSNKVQRRF